MSAGFEQQRTRAESRSGANDPLLTFAVYAARDLEFLFSRPEHDLVDIHVFRLADRKGY